jgi:hypothetical protein
MADDREPSPQRMGGFLLWVGIAVVAALVVFLVVFLLTGHKSSLMKNSQLNTLPHPTAVAVQLPSDRLLAFSADLVPGRS